jgi:hypothetical protein
MPSYLRPEVVREAAARLMSSRAQRGFLDFLVLKRALALSAANTVPFSKNDPNFTRAIRELAGLAQDATVAPDDPMALSAFFKVFGIAQPVSAKMITNGSADTLSGPAWKQVVRLEGQRPRSGGLQPGYESHLERLLLKHVGDKPSIADSAVWFFRATDLDSNLTGTVRDGNDLLETLKAAFTQDLGLTEGELTRLFGSVQFPRESDPVSTWIQPTVAAPRTYLPPRGEIEVLPAAGANFAREFDLACSAASTGIRLQPNMAMRLVSSLLAKRFVILTGLAGSGKTKIAQAFAHWITPDPGWNGTEGASRQRQANPYYALVPVGADWTGNENIIGYPNGLDGSGYVTTPTLELVRHAVNLAYSSLPHFLILDEMNLSHVERYFADMLSAIESGEEIPLYEGTSRKAGSNEVLSRLRLPANLFVIGTVNVDETTYMFSPKVLDRANVLEFRMDPQELRGFLANPTAPRLEELDGKGSQLGEGFVRAAAERVPGVPESVRAEFEEEMMLFFTLLRDHNAEFGYRVAHEAARFVHFYHALGSFGDDDTSWFSGAMDAVIVQKLLPKLHGSRSRLEGLLWALAWACGAPREEKNGNAFLAQVHAAGLAEDENSYGPQKLWDQLYPAVPAMPSEAARYPLSYDKVMRMWRRLCNDQFVTFAEA